MSLRWGTDHPHGDKENDHLPMRKRVSACKKTTSISGYEEVNSYENTPDRCRPGDSIIFSHLGMFCSRISVCAGVLACRSLRDDRVSPRPAVVRRADGAGYA